MPLSIGRKSKTLQEDMNREETLIRITATASINLEMIVDTLTSTVLDMIEEAKKLGIYKQERKQKLNLLLHEVKLHQNMLDRRAGESIGNVADYNEAYSEQIQEEKQKSLEEATKVLIGSNVPNPTYLAYLHQARVIGIASHLAIKLWTNKMNAASSPLPCEFTLEPFRPKKVMDRLQQLMVFEFQKYQGRQEDSEEAQKADKEFVGKMADTKMICDIMEGRIKPSWMQDEPAPVNNPDAESVIKE